MIIIGVDYHPSFQQIAFMDQKTGEYGERQLNHSDGEAEKFYRELQHRGVHARVGMEATGYALWFERLLGEKAENRPRGRPTYAGAAAGKSLSKDLGTQSGES